MTLKKVRIKMEFLMFIVIIVILILVITHFINIDKKRKVKIPQFPTNNQSFSTISTNSPVVKKTETPISKPTPVPVLKKYSNQKIMISATAEVKNTFSIEETETKFNVQFTKNGKSYPYNKTSIEILEVNTTNNNHTIMSTSPPSNVTPLKHSNNTLVYSLRFSCYRCGQQHETKTYIVYTGTTENVEFPWNKSELNKRKTWEHSLAHMADETIEYYGLECLGDNLALDAKFAKHFPEIKQAYSQTTKQRTYMSHCSSCGAHQGHYYLYSRINTAIKNNSIIKVISEI